MAVASQHVAMTGDLGWHQEWVAFGAINEGGTARVALVPLRDESFLSQIAHPAMMICERIRESMDIAFHLVPQSYFDALDPHSDYTPLDFAGVGFIHCTNGADEMTRVANALYKSNPEPHYYLYIDKARIRAPVRYDDASAQKYPHIYGALNRDAIDAIRPARREADGTFLPPEALPETKS